MTEYLCHHLKPYSVVDEVHGGSPSSPVRGKGLVYASVLRCLLEVGVIALLDYDRELVVLTSFPPIVANI